MRQIIALEDVLMVIPVSREERMEPQKSQQLTLAGQFFSTDGSQTYSLFSCLLLLLRVISLSIFISHNGILPSFSAPIFSLAHQKISKITCMAVDFGHDVSIQSTWLPVLSPFTSVEF